MRTWLRALRVQKGQTQEKVAEAAGISRCYYTQIETNNLRRGPHPNVAMKIASVLEFDWAWIFDEARVPKSLMESKIKKKSWREENVG